MPIPTDIYNRIISAKMFIDENFHQPLNLEHISSKAFLSPFHFHRLFSRIYKKTPHKYLTLKRIERAKELLSQNRNVTEVCNEVGFESIGSFSTLFKKENGIAPQYYRNFAHSKKQKEITEPASLIPNCFIQQMNCS